MLFVTIVLDGVGIGEQPDASVYGDVGSDTLGHVLAHRPVIHFFSSIYLFLQLHHVFCYTIN